MPAAPCVKPDLMSAQPHPCATATFHHVPGQPGTLNPHCLSSLLRYQDIHRKTVLHVRVRLIALESGYTGVEATPCQCFHQLRKCTDLGRGATTMNHAGVLERKQFDISKSFCLRADELFMAVSRAEGCFAEFIF